MRHNVNDAESPPFFSYFLTLFFYSTHIIIYMYCSEYYENITHIHSTFLVTIRIFYCICEEIKTATATNIERQSEGKWVCGYGENGKWIGWNELQNNDSPSLTYKCDVMPIILYFVTYSEFILCGIFLKIKVNFFIFAFQMLFVVLHSLQWFIFQQQNLNIFFFFRFPLIGSCRLKFHPLTIFSIQQKKNSTSIKKGFPHPVTIPLTFISTFFLIIGVIFIPRLDMLSPH